MSTKTYTAQTDETMEGFLDTLTGFDELAIAHHFDGFDPYAHAEQKPVMTMRVLIFVHQLRKDTAEGFVSPTQAKQVAMAMPLAEAFAYFVDDEGTDLNPETMETPAGEGPSAVE